MYPFDRFTDAAKVTLTLAHEEAGRSPVSYVGPEHLLLGMLQQPDACAGNALARLGFSYEAVREQVEGVLGSNERVIIQQIIPTSRVKKVIEVAFEEARRLDSRVVATDHLLLGLMIEGESIAAHVLIDAGATLDRVRETVTAVRQSGLVETSTRQAAEAVRQHHAESAPPRGAEAVSLGAERILVAARAEAVSDALTEVSDAHVLRALIKLGDNRVMRSLETLGTDGVRLLELLTPPERIVKLRRSLQEAADQKYQAVTREDYQSADQALQREASLRAELDSAEREWDGG